MTVHTTLWPGILHGVVELVHPGHGRSDAATHTSDIRTHSRDGKCNTERLCSKSSNGKRDWTTSYKRQLEFYQWLQSAEGGIAGGATNSWNGRYEKYPAGTSTFYGMAYVPHPVYADPVVTSGSDSRHGQCSV